MSTESPSVTPAGGAGPGVELSALQHAWLTEIGLERRLLVPYRRPAAVPDVAASANALVSGSTPVAAGAPVSAAVPTGMPGSAPDYMATQVPASGHASDPVAAALKQAGVRRRARPSAPANDGLQPIGEHIERARAPSVKDLPSDWAALQDHALACQACDLQLQRDRLVFGAGDTDQPDWLIVGEAPGKADDRTGLPFQGKAGKLLHAMLVAVGVHPTSLVLGGQPLGVPAWSQHTSMYFTTLNKCRPLANRSPVASEAAACLPYLLQQIELLQPRRVLALGRLAAQALLQVDDDIEDLRGRIHHVTTSAGAQVPVIVTWHPAALLMHPQNKEQAWIDLNMAKRLQP